MRRKLSKKPELAADPKYGSQKVSKFINHLMERGKKSVARELVYGALEIVKEQAKVEDPMETFDLALKNVAPQVEVRSRRVGGANYQVPRETRPERRNFLAMTWMIAAARSKKGKPMAQKLAEEIILAAKNEGEAAKKKDDIYRMAQANKAFAHYRW
jgi:small subunit ribosomal protein S7